MKIAVAARAAGVALLATGAVVAGGLPAAADSFASPEMLQAMQRDLGLTAEQAADRVASELKATEVEKSVRDALGNAFAGAHFDEGSAKLVVSVTDAAKAAAVEAAGATAKVVSRTAAALDGVKGALDAAESSLPKGVTGWYVDVKSNNVVVNVQPGAANEARAQLAALPEAAAIKVVETDEAPTPLYDVRGGDAYYMGGGRCSIGFSVQGGFVTAGHCGRTGTATQGFNRVAQGTFRGSTFPGNGDFGWVATNSNWTPRGVVNRYSGSTTVRVAGSSESAVGASICRSGSTTGWRCGTVQAKNQTVRYPQGAVTGMTRTNACAEPGDSGGSWLSGTQAQGVTSGGSGNCSSGGTTYFQPVNEILSAYGLRLVTS
ncbi:S1 family peptidase [Crossiella sp. CA-258035]|uniref:S1 family peptidase n=1 Tax=Crossiella sp. CA-258035 TaxID=2981138 RepID=UPI0024BC96EF|nr:S1 family peptidase [Crossiella sp. CA-258035]WHT19937.1 S1 family peptidase [Crossiella sp. CA-258035]